MKHNFMYDLYFGNLIPWERGLHTRPDDTPINRKISDIKHHYKATMSKEEYQRFEELEDLYSQSSSINETDIFGYGLSMGILLMIEVFGFKEKRLTEQESE